MLISWSNYVNRYIFFSSIVCYLCQNPIFMNLERRTIDQKRKLLAKNKTELIFLSFKENVCFQITQLIQKNDEAETSSKANTSTIEMQYIDSRLEMKNMWKTHGKRKLQFE